MDNQHRKIKGYNELSQETINDMNQIKSFGIDLDVIINTLLDNKDYDAKWIELGKVDLQVGLMKVIRGIAKPSTF